MKEHILFSLDILNFKCTCNLNDKHDIKKTTSGYLYFMEYIMAHITRVAMVVGSSVWFNDKS